METISLAYKNYIVYSDGRILGPKGKFLKPYYCTGRNGNTYYKVKLVTYDGRRNKFEIWFVHRLVAYVFYGPFEDYAWTTAIIDHIDMNTGNNRLDNLEVVDCRENLRRAREERESVPF